eukprot:5392624-Alexandrium_andersonii.AAC.1
MDEDWGNRRARARATCRTAISSGWIGLDPGLLRRRGARVRGACSGRAFRRSRATGSLRRFSRIGPSSLGW